MGQILLFLFLFGLWGHCPVWFRIFSYLTCLFFSSSNPSCPLFILSFFCCINIWFFFPAFYAGLLWVVQRTTAGVHPHWTCHFQIFGVIWTVSVQICDVNSVSSVCVCVCARTLMDRWAIPFQLCSSFTHLALHYTALMFLRCKLNFWGKEKWPVVPVITLNSIRVGKCGRKDKLSKIHFEYLAGDILNARTAKHSNNIQTLQIPGDRTKEVKLNSHRREKLAVSLQTQQ